VAVRFSLVSLPDLLFFQVNYLASDTAVREHMEPAIGTVLNFTDADLEKIKKQKVQSEGWF
jgi:hypothetical protein